MSMSTCKASPCRHRYVLGLFHSLDPAQQEPDEIIALDGCTAAAEYLIGTRDEHPDWAFEIMKADSAWFVRWTIRRNLKRVVRKPKQDDDGDQS